MFKGWFLQWLWFAITETTTNTVCSLTLCSSGEWSAEPPFSLKGFMKYWKCINWNSLFQKGQASHQNILFSVDKIRQTCQLVKKSCIETYLQSGPIILGSYVLLFLCESVHILKPCHFWKWSITVEVIRRCMFCKTSLHNYTWLHRV